MIAYGCIGILFLFVAVKSIMYEVHRRRSLSPDEIDQRLRSMLNPKREQQ